MNGDNHIRKVKEAIGDQFKVYKKRIEYNRPWLTQEEIDAEQRKLDDEKARDDAFLRIAAGLVLIYAGYILYDVVAGWLP